MEDFLLPLLFSISLLSSVQPGWTWAEFPYMPEVLRKNAVTRGYSS